MSVDALQVTPVGSQGPQQQVQQPPQPASTTSESQSRPTINKLLSEQAKTVADWAVKTFYTIVLIPAVSYAIFREIPNPYAGAVVSVLAAGFSEYKILTLDDKESRKLTDFTLNFKHIGLVLSGVLLARYLLPDNITAMVLSQNEINQDLANIDKVDL